MLKTHKKQHSTLDAGLSTDFIFLITSYPPPATSLSRRSRTARRRTPTHFIFCVFLRLFAANSCSTLDSRLCTLVSRRTLLFSLQVTCQSPLPCPAGVAQCVGGSQLFRHQMLLAEFPPGNQQISARPDAPVTKNIMMRMQTIQNSAIPQLSRKRKGSIGIR
jgi:hypothetical protein